MILALITNAYAKGKSAAAPPLRRVAATFLNQSIS